MSYPVVFIVEGHCEYDVFPSVFSKVVGNRYIPVSNAKGIGNIIKNTASELLLVVKTFKPKKIIITLDYRDALKEGLVSDCLELKNKVQQNCDSFLIEQAKGSLELPDEIVVIIADKTYESWLCADYLGLKENELINSESITETFNDVDSEIASPASWLKSKLKENVDLKAKANRKNIAKTLRPEVAIQNSRSFRKFHKEISTIEFDY